jgi:hypothetical protein
MGEADQIALDDFEGKTLFLRDFALWASNIIVYVIDNYNA